MLRPVYPSSPWNLNATAHVSFWRVPSKDFRVSLGEGIEPLSILRSVLVATGFVNYEATGDLTYRELFLAVLVKAQRKWAVNVPLIWVDSAAALQGGRDLWAIPKQLASFSIHGSKLSADSPDPQSRLAELSFTPRIRLPGRPEGSAYVIQARLGTLLRTPMSASTQIEYGSGRWYIPEASPLSILRGRWPLFSVKFSAARVRFGA
jgi:hypothetical protein